MTEEPEDLSSSPPEEQPEQPAPEAGGQMESPTEGAAADAAAGQPGEYPGPEEAAEETNWRTIGIIAVVGIVVVVVLLLLFSALGPGSGGAETPTPEAAGPRIEIQSPENGAVLDIANPVTVSGFGAALPEGNVVVQALDSDSNVLAEAATIIDAPDAGTGGAGPWSVQLSVQTEPGTAGTIVAFSNSPADGSTLASDSVAVSFGATEAVEPFININEPTDGATLDTSNPVTVNGNGGGLPEGNVVVRAVDSNDNILAEAQATINAPDAGTGGQGPWEVQLNIATAPGTPGQIVAFSTSPADGSTIASDSVPVSFGATEPVESFIEIQEPADGGVVDTSGPVAVSGMGGGLFEGNVVVQATASDGSVLAESAATVQSDEVGGSGPWSTTLDIQAEPGTTGQIIAFSPSPVDGSIMASATINLTYGEAPTEPTATPEGPQVDITKHHWTLMSNGGSAVIEGTFIDISFGDDGQVTGSAGCNSYFGPYTIDGDSISVGELGVTRVACPEPPGLMEQETAYLSLLQTAATYEVTQPDGQLIVRDGSGSEILVYNASVNGLVTTQSGEALPDDAVITVQLQDTSLQDVPAVVVGEQVIQANGRQLPLAYNVLYNPNDIREGLTYTMSVRITDGGGNLLFINDTAIRVITDGFPTTNVEVPVIAT
ncbi:MAG: Gmad2 immunoglobulin-like domain-containing protein [Anaerolineales bacterium]|nr:Gmad2 immunoglobulin-like domain-containing protein [Anaerolineales bacterium]